MTNMGVSSFEGADMNDPLRAGLDVAFGFFFIEERDRLIRRRIPRRFHPI
jgi:hypothetical protein